MDLNRTAFRIVQQLSGEKPESKRTATARRAGTAGGAVRAANLPAERRKEIAVAANKARWKDRK